MERIVIRRRSLVKDLSIFPFSSSTSIIWDEFLIRLSLALQTLESLFKSGRSLLKVFEKGFRPKEDQTCYFMDRAVAVILHHQALLLHGAVLRLLSVGVELLLHLVLSQLKLNDILLPLSGPLHRPMILKGESKKDCINLLLLMVRKIQLIWNGWMEDGWQLRDMSERLRRERERDCPLASLTSLITDERPH